MTQAASSTATTDPGVPTGRPSDPGLARTIAPDTTVDEVPPKVSDESFIKKIVNKAVQDVIQDETYSHEATSVWTNKIVELLVRTLVNIDRDNKYIGELLTCHRCVNSAPTCHCVFDKVF